MRKTSPKWRLGTIALVLLTMVANVAVAPGSASASPSQGYVRGMSGDDPYIDDWDDEGPLSVSENLHSNVVAAWQQILWADGFLPWSGIDCWFGNQTSEATRRWKVKHKLDNNGIAGKRAFRVIIEKLQAFELNAWTYNGIADGPLRSITFRRANDGIWSMSISGDWHNLGYNYANFDVCT